MDTTNPGADEGRHMKGMQMRDFATTTGIGRSRPIIRPAGHFPVRYRQGPGALPRRAAVHPAGATRGGRVIRAVEKICVIGDAAVGKTSLVRRFARDRFDDEYLTTCGAKVLQKKMTLRYTEQDTQVRLMLQMWDVTGQNIHSRLSPTFFRGASGAMVVSEAVRLDTQIDIWKWVEAFRAVAGNVPVMIVVNKTDIMDQREFDYLLMDDISAEYGCLYTMTSARTGENVEGAFKLLCDFIVRTKLNPQRKEGRAC